MPRGRPVKSVVRQNIIEILYFLKGAYGYELYKIYREIFPKTTMRNVYYHLKKGVSLKEIEIQKIEKVQGNYSWGPEAEKVFYKLGPNANPKIDLRVKKSLEKIKRNK